MEPNTPGFAFGLILGAILIGCLRELIPLFVGRIQGCPGLGWLGFGLCTLSGLILGLIGALPMDVVVWGVILVVGPRPGSSGGGGPDRGLGTPSGPVDL